MKLHLKEFLNKEHGFWQDYRVILKCIPAIQIEKSILKNVHKTHSLRQQPSGLLTPIFALWIAWEQVHKDSSALLSSSLLSFPPCMLYANDSSLSYSVLFYVARSMPSKDTCFVVTCKNKARIISLLCILFSICGMAWSLPRGWEGTQIV